jgi:uncharacterized repeat protein (TIGR03803 family)
MYPHATFVRGPDGAFYGSTEQGGVNKGGQLFKMNPDGSEYNVLKDFSGPDGSGPEAALLLAGDTLYGTTTYGGISNNGTVFKLNLDGSGFTVLKRFGGYDGAQPYSALVLSGATLYGTTYFGGTSNLGTIFKIGTDGSDFAVLRSFSGDDGAHPVAGLCLSPAGVLYGTTWDIVNYGNVFAVNLDGSGFRVLKAFDSGVKWPNGTLVLSGATLYGTTISGTNSPGAHGGTVFKVNVDGSGFAVLKDFVQSEGAWPDANLVLSGDTLYGSTYLGGAFNDGSYYGGTVFKVKTDGSGFAVIKSFTLAEGNAGFAPYEVDWGAGLYLSGITLSGTIPRGGLAHLGALFQINTDGSEYTVLKEFTGGDGAQPYSGIALGSDGTLYGTTYIGGNASQGTVFSLNPDGTDYTILKAFSGSDGESPEAGVAVSGTTLYGTTTYGGISNYGTLFRMNTDGSSFSVLWSCLSYSDGVFPSTVPVVSGTALYGGIDYGRVFRINTDGTSYSSFLINNNYAYHSYQASAILDGSTLYGTDGDSLMYKINTDWSGFALIRVMSGNLRGPLALSGNTLYGTTYNGGASLYGTVFKVNTDGTGYGVLKELNGGSDGSGPSSGLLLSGNVLFGTCVWSQNGVNRGTVFKINTDGTGFAVLKTFHGYDGDYPLGNLVLSGTNLYGTTLRGGDLDQGVVFRLSVPAVLPLILASPPSQTAEAAATVTFSAKADGVPPLMYDWFFGSTHLGVSTNRSLTLPNIQPSQAGAYTVVVTNVFGAATSAPAMLSVIAPVARRPVPGIPLTGAVGTILNLESSDAMEPVPTWQHLDTVTMTTNPQWWFDLTDPIRQQRFYRVMQSGRPIVAPSLGLPLLVPAITLTGAIGSSVRVDYINKFGPTDAWVTLDTVTLTSNPQLFFDVAAPGQPARLYRIVPVP